jgi:hypothetical protein
MDPIVLTDEEVDQLHEYTVNSYLDVNRWTALRRLLDLVDGYRAERTRRTAPILVVPDARLTM